MLGPTEVGAILLVDLGRAAKRLSELLDVEHAVSLNISLPDFVAPVHELLVGAVDIEAAQLVPRSSISCFNRRSEHG